MLEALISSKTRVKLLTLFLLNPGSEFYIREIVRTTGDNINAVRRELANLESFGLITGQKKGNLQYYTVSTGHFLYADLQKIVLKTEGIAGLIKEALSEEKITCMFIYGSYAKGTAGAKSDIDLFIVGDVDEDRIIPVIHSCEQAAGREINYTLMTLSELKMRKKNRDPFVKNVLSEAKILIRGTCDD
ncbi:nucleotidyltransferase domain-containing protein [uncultured Methanoregula sp.]|uniref:nucleotidyltransferase domain-containing protein n=1 Tax=uncultured Methanoregula sp. TaxID=1005933 RepID=UPI002AABFA8E|nr:nucleotidyltransferase domain-containing protein [uncultured Methanoregula sp.]